MFVWGGAVVALAAVCAVLLAVSGSEAALASVGDARRRAVEAKALELASEPGADAFSCGFCEFLIFTIKTYLTAGSTEKEIAHVVDGICQYVPTKWEGSCTELIDEYGPTIITLLVDNEKAEVICCKITLCNCSSTTSGGSMLAQLPAPERSDLARVLNVEEPVLHETLSAAVGPDGVVDCLTTELWQLQNPDANCAATKCDVPSVRNSSNTSPKKVRVAAHTFFPPGGKQPDGVTKDVLRASLESVDAQLQMYGLGLEISGVYEHESAKYTNLPAYSQTNSKWYTTLLDMKAAYAVSPTTTLNIFISGQDQGSVGTLLGIATFPWDKAALTKTGGLWCNGVAVNEKAQTDKVATLAHELGHNLGLWHQFHGVSEVTCSSSCYENYHAIFAEEANLVGDFAADTMATPKNYECAQPPSAERDCTGKSFTGVDYRNLMGYSRRPSDCRSVLTDDQVRRMHCYLCNSLSSQLVDSSMC